MVTVEASDLGERFLDCLREVEAGATILIAEQGRPVAEIRPLPPVARDLPSRLHELAAEGFLRLPTRRPSVSIRRVAVPEPALSETVIEDREDRI